MEGECLFALHPFDLALMLPSLPTPLRAADSQGSFAWPGQDQGHERESQPKVPGRVLQPVPFSSIWEPMPTLSQD